MNKINLPKRKNQIYSNKSMQQFKPNPQNTVHKQNQMKPKWIFKYQRTRKKNGSNQIFQSNHCRVAEFHFGTRKNETINIYITLDVDGRSVHNTNVVIHLVGW